MKGPRRRNWAEMDHDGELLFEQVVRLNRVDHRGPIAEFLAKKHAEQARQTADA